MEILGIHEEGAKIKIALVRKNKEGIEVKLLKETEDRDLPTLLQEKRDTVTALDCSDLLIRHLQLKLTNKRALAKALPFQMESALPYPPEQTVVFPFLNTSKTHTDITLFATTKELLRKHIDEKEKKGLHPDLVTAEPSALVRFARYYFPEHTSLYFFHVEEEKGTCGVLHQGKLYLAHSMRWERGTLSVQKEFDRAFSFLRKKAPLDVPLKEVLITGASSSKKAIEEMLPAGFTLLKCHDDLSSFALPLGLALEGTTRDRDSLNFRLGPYTSPKAVRKKKGLIRSYLFFCAGLFFLTAVGGFFLLSKKEARLLSHLSLFSSSQTDNLGQALTQVEEKMETQTPPFPFLSTAPPVTDLLAWLGSHPLFTKEKSIDIKHLTYTLTKYPKLGGKIEPYSAKVEIHFTATSPQIAKEFQEALQKGDLLVNPKGEISWKMDENSYKATFSLRRVP